MKNIKLFYKILLFIMVFMTSCNRDILELEPLNSYSDAAVWKDPILAETYLNGVYMKMEVTFNNKYCIENFVDELHRRDGSTQVDFNNCKLTTDQIPGWTDNPTYATQYLAIRACNKFFENIEKLPDDGILVDGVTKKNRMIGEVHFLRAWFYMRLTSLFGGVPLIDKEYQFCLLYTSPSPRD